VVRFPSAEWLDAYAAKINASPEYAEAAATWEGDLTYVFGAEPDKGVPNDIWVWMDLFHGTCRAQRYDVGEAEGSKSKFLIRAPYTRWKEVMTGELDPIKGMMTGKLKLKGNLATLVRYTKAAKVLVSLAGEVDTEFADGASS
jgi:putative sterol carrier protein